MDVVAALGLCSGAGGLLGPVGAPVSSAHGAPQGIGYVACGKCKISGLVKGGCEGPGGGGGGGGGSGWQM